MSKDWFQDVNDMHNKYEIHDAVSKMNTILLKENLKFRIEFLKEELHELEAAENGDDAVDALIDLCVVAIGTLDMFKVNAWDAWDEVHAANMTKERGINGSRPNPLGLPDLVKPKNFKRPSHEGNTGLLEDVFK